MKYKHILYIFFAILFCSCENDDYLIDGGISSPYLNKSTYDYLASNPLFDTLVMAIDKAGLKSELDKTVTLFAPTNFSFNNYIQLKTEIGRLEDPNFVYKFEDIPVEVLRDSLSMYIFTGKILRQDLRKEGDIFTNIIGTELKIALMPQKDFTEELPNNPEYVEIFYKRGKFWDKWDAKELPPAEQDTKVRIQTSGLLSTNGVIHVLQNTHTLFFTKKN